MNAPHSWNKSLKIKKTLEEEKNLIIYQNLCKSRHFGIWTKHRDLIIVRMYISFHFQSTDAIVKDSVVKAGILSL